MNWIILLFPGNRGMDQWNLHHAQEVISSLYTHNTAYINASQIFDYLLNV